MTSSVAASSGLQESLLPHTNDNINQKKENVLTRLFKLRCCIKAPENSEEPSPLELSKVPVENVSGSSSDVIVANVIANEAVSSVALPSLGSSESTKTIDPRVSQALEFALSKISPENLFAWVLKNDWSRDPSTREQISTGIYILNFGIRDVTHIGTLTTLWKNKEEIKKLMGKMSLFDFLDFVLTRSLHKEKGLLILQELEKQHQALHAVLKKEFPGEEVSFENHFVEQKLIAKRAALQAEVDGLKTQSQKSSQKPLKGLPELIIERTSQIATLDILIGLFKIPVDNAFNAFFERHQLNPEHAKLFAEKKLWLNFIKFTFGILEQSVINGLAAEQISGASVIPAVPAEPMISLAPVVVPPQISATPVIARFTDIQLEAIKNAIEKIAQTNVGTQRTEVVDYLFYQCRPHLNGVTAFDFISSAYKNHKKHFQIIAKDSKKLGYTKLGTLFDHILIPLYKKPNNEELDRFYTEIEASPYLKIKIKKYIDHSKPELDSLIRRLFESEL